MAAESLAWDFDLRYERQDYDRFLEHWQLAPEGLILQGGSDGDKVTFGFRPEHIQLVEPDQADFTATVEFTEQLGGETYLYCASDGMPQLTIHQPGQLPVRTGQVLNLSIDRPAIHLFASDGRVITNGITS